MENLRFLQSCIYTSKSLALVATSKTFVIEEFNLGFQNLVRYDSNLLAGTPLKTFLHKDSWHLLKADLPERKMPLRFIFKSLDGGSIVVNCHINRTDHGYLLFGDQALLNESDVLKKMTVLNNEMAAMTRELNRKNRALLEAQEQIKTLTGIIPICMYCKEIRDDAGFWNQLEIFIEKHSDAKFSHGICEKCMENKFAEQLSRRKQKEESEKK